MTACGDKVAYLSEYLANNAARLHQFVHPACDDIHAYPCLDHWHIGHNLPAAGQRCKAEEGLKPRRDPHRPDTPPTRSKRGAA